MRAIFFILGIFLCCALKAQDLSVRAIPEEISHEAKAVVRLSDKTLTLKSFNRMQIDQTLIITVFREEGNGYAFLPMHYNKEIKLLDYSGEVLNGNGIRLKEFRKKDYKDVSAVDQGTLYADDRVLFYDYKPTQYPYTVKHNYRYETSNTAFIPDWRPVRAYDMGIEKDLYSFVNESGLKVIKNQINISDFEDKITFSESGNNFTYELNNFAPLSQEVMSPGLDEITPQVMVTTQKFELAGFPAEFTDWNEFGLWMYNDLIEGRQALPEAEKKIIANMLHGIESDKEKTRLLYQYMQNKTRYINVAIGIGGWQPYPAEHVSTKGYGDCKALTNYMMSLLSEAEIPSNYTVVYGNDDPVDIKADFTSMQGNHVILHVPLENDTIWLECTSQQTAFNHLGEFTGNRDALSVSAQGGKIIKTQQFPPEKNREIIKGNGKIGPDGVLDLDFNVETHGTQYDHTFYLGMLNKLDQENWLQNRYSAIKTKTFKSFAFENDKNNAVFRQQINLSAPAYAQTAADNLIFPLVPLGRFETSLKKDSSRKLPLQINYGYADTSEFIFEIPDGYGLHYEPESVEINSEFGNYSLQYEIKDRQLKVTRSMLTKAGRFGPEKYMDYVEFRRSIEKADNTKILLEK